MGRKRANIIEKQNLQWFHISMNFLLDCIINPHCQCRRMHNRGMDETPGRSNGGPKWLLDVSTELPLDKSKYTGVACGQHDFLGSHEEGYNILVVQDDGSLSLAIGICACLNSKNSGAGGATRDMEKPDKGTLFDKIWWGVCTTEPTELYRCRKAGRGTQL